MALNSWKNKINAVLKMEAPKTLKQLCGFIGMVNYYQDMWPYIAHVLPPQMSQTGAPRKGEKQPNTFGQRKCKLHLIK
jgi:hypothetical protein